MCAPVQAYIDPNTSGLLYSIFFPLIIAASLSWRWLASSVGGLWRKLFRRAP